MRTTFSASNAINASTRTTISLARIGALTVTGVTIKRTKISASSSELETSACLAIEGLRCLEEPGFSAGVMS